MTRADAADLYQVGNPVGDNPGFAATRPRQNKHRATDSLDRLSLRGVKFGKNIHSMLIIPLEAGELKEGRGYRKPKLKPEV
jgi:hypothetical protein